MPRFFFFWEPQSTHFKFIQGIKVYDAWIYFKRKSKEEGHSLLDKTNMELVQEQSDKSVEKNRESETSKHLCGNLLCDRHDTIKHLCGKRMDCLKLVVGKQLITWRKIDWFALSSMYKGEIQCQSNNYKANRRRYCRC